jgi:hypothetical protein
MGGEDCCLVLLVWVVPNAIIGLLIGFSEIIGYQLSGCEPRIADWLRYGYIQYAFIDLAILCGITLPRKYTAYFDRFMNQGYVSFGLAFVFSILQVMTPWITLTLYLKLRSNCYTRITTGHAAYYWIMFSVQLIVSILYCFCIYFFSIELCRRILPNLRRLKNLQLYYIEASKLLDRRRNLRKSYANLFSTYNQNMTSLTTVDLKFFHRALSKHLDSETFNILQDHKRLCWRCKDGFHLGERIIVLEGCRHVFHWECFRSVIGYRNLCPECSRAVIGELKKQMISGELLKPMNESVRIPPCVKPTNLETRRNLPAMPLLNAHPIVTIEYFNYTLQALPEQIPEQFQIAVAEA